MLARPSSLSFLISLKERRGIECNCTVILTLAKVSGDVSTCALYPAGHFGMGGGSRAQFSIDVGDHQDV